MNTYGFLKDGSNKYSAKRIFGGIILLSGIFVGFISSIISLFYVIHDKEMIKIFIDTCFISGSSLVGAGVIENFSNKKKVQNDKP